MLIRNSITGYRHIDLGNIKLAFTQVCKEELFKDVYFAANTLYYVEAGKAILNSRTEKVIVKKGEIALIRQHSKLDIQKFRDDNGNDFKSIIFYLFPDYVSDYLKQVKYKEKTGSVTTGIIHLGKHTALKSFCESLLPLFNAGQLNYQDMRKKTFYALNHLSLHNKTLLHFLHENRNPVKIDLYEFMIHIAVNNYSVEELAKLTGRSRSAFKRDFNLVFETTPHQWLLRKKIEYAEQLIKDKEMKLSDICYMLGFNEPSHFSEAFKKIRGVSPSQLTG